MPLHMRLSAAHLFLKRRHAIDELSEFRLNFERTGKAGPNGIFSHACHTLRCGPSLFCAIVDSRSISISDGSNGDLSASVANGVEAEINL